MQRITTKLALTYLIILLIHGLAWSRSSSYMEENPVPNYEYGSIKSDIYLKALVIVLDTTPTITSTIRDLQLCGFSDAVHVYDVYVSDAFSGLVLLSVSFDIPGLEVSLQEIQVQPGGRTFITLQPKGVIPAGLHEVVINGSDGISEANLVMTLDVIGNVPPTIGLRNPINRGIIHDIDVRFDWVPNSSDLYWLELSKEATFPEERTERRQSKFGAYVWRDLDFGTPYFYRVKGINICGVSDEWSTIGQFRTVDTTCMTYRPQDLPIRIDDVDPDTIRSFITISDTGRVASLRIPKMKGRHTSVGELGFSLGYPDLQDRGLLGSVCFDQDDFDLSFANNGADTVRCPLTTPQTFRLGKPWYNSRKIPSHGLWSLMVTDRYSRDGGSLDAWELEVCHYPSERPDLTADTTYRELCVRDTAFFQLLIGHNFSGPVHISNSYLGPYLERIIRPGPYMPGDTVTIGFRNTDEEVGGLTGFHVIAKDSFFIDSIALRLRFLQYPHKPILYHPLNNFVITKNRVLLRWWGDFRKARNHVHIWPTDRPHEKIVYRDIRIQEKYLEPEMGVSYSWCVEAENDCGSVFSDTTSFDMALPTQVEDPALAMPMLVFPNPTSGPLQITPPKGLSGRLTVEIFDLAGGLLHQEFVQSDGLSPIPLDLSIYPTGSYLVRLKTAGEVHTTKVILVR